MLTESVEKFGTHNKSGDLYFKNTTTPYFWVDATKSSGATEPFSLTNGVVLNVPDTSTCQSLRVKQTTPVIPVSDHTLSTETYALSFIVKN